MIRVGVLECDHVDERHRPIGGDTVDMLRALFAAHAPDAGLELVPVDPTVLDPLAGSGDSVVAVVVGVAAAVG